MHSLIHGVYSNYLVIDLADYIFCSAMIFFVQHFVGDFGNFTVAMSRSRSRSPAKVTFSPLQRDS